jgi:Helix-turn-helix domain
MRTDTQNTALLDTRDLAERLTPPSGNGPSSRTLERWRSEGSGPAFVKVGRRALYRETDVEQWLEQQRRSFTTQTGEGR